VTQRLNNTTDSTKVLDVTICDNYSIKKHTAGTGGVLKWPWFMCCSCPMEIPVIQ